MKYALIAVGTLMLGMLVGCGPVDMNEDSSPEQLEVPADGTQHSQEMMAAVLAKLPDELLHAAVACQPTKTCAGYDACTDWSSVYNCGTLSECNASDAACKVCETKPGGIGSICEFHGGQRQTQNRYRVCFNSERESCTEYQRTVSPTAVCGCANL